MFIACLTTYGRGFVFKALVSSATLCPLRVSVACRLSSGYESLHFGSPWPSLGEVCALSPCTSQGESLYPWFLMQFSLFLSFCKLYLAYCCFPNDWHLSTEVLIDQKRSLIIKIIICYSWKTEVSRIGLMMFFYLASLWLYSTSHMVDWTS